MNIVERFGFLTPFFQRHLLRIEYGAAFGLLLFGIVIGPHYMVEGLQLGPASRMQIGAMLLTGIVLAWVLIGPPGGALLARLGSLRTPGFLPIVIGGVIAQVAVALLTDPIPVSDGLTYLRLANEMVTHGRYVDELGARAFWPPGLPLFLTPFVAVFGVSLAAVTLANVVLYLAGAAGIWSIGRQLFGAPVAGLATLLFSLWPSRLLTAGVASKENLTVAAVAGGLALALAAFRSAGTRRWLLAAAAGIGFGLAALAQPGLLLFTVACPLCYRWCGRDRPLRFLAMCGVIIGFTVLTMAPWHVRNCVVFEGQFCGLATNGGSVFYRANNPLANGAWTPEGAIPITHLPELEQNRLGFIYGKQWIKENPAAFAKLSFKKLGLLLRDDVYGSYWGIFRGAGVDHDASKRGVTAGRMLAYRIGHVLSWVFYVAVLGCAAHALLTGLRAATMSERVLPLIYPLLYAAAVFSVFESGSRQHMIAMALLLVLAAAAMAAAFEASGAAGRAARKDAPATPSGLAA